MFLLFIIQNSSQFFHRKIILRIFFYIIFLIQFIINADVFKTHFTKRLYLSFVSAAAYSLWSLLLKYNPVSKVAVFGFLNPICGVCISTIFLKEKDAFHIFTIPALVFVCVGIYIVNHKKQNAWKERSCIEINCKMDLTNARQYVIIIMHAVSI